ncbi:ankyrin repeat protein [Metarhizium robertsii]|uniref:Ankyrin repeat protein n=1 Tax=Metarhizium robertsii TaxID=568076 RepID=A0A014PPH3_9HYPO|nr:ankyrin repeat protein [Metarhizium robertsii]
MDTAFSGEASEHSPTRSDSGNHIQAGCCIVHVTGLRRESDRLSIDSILKSSITTLRREIIFPCDIAQLLIGDFTRDVVHTTALRLLNSLACLADKDASKRNQKSKHAIIFVAYDLGALILKTALSVAEKERYNWPDTFTSSARVIFCGAPQRSDSLFIMESKLYEFLHDDKNAPWLHLLTPSSIRGLAQAALESTDEFLSSKFTLRGRIAFDEAAATLGVPLEESLGEMDWDNADASSLLATKVCHLVEQWVPDPDQVAAEQTLLSLAVPDSPFGSTKPLESHPILQDTEHQKWIEGRGHRLIYVHGTDRNASIVAAEQIFAKCRQRMQALGIPQGCAFSFSFSSRDPLRRSASSMICTMISHDLTTHRKQTALHGLVLDQYRLQNGWTEQDAMLWLNMRWLGELSSYRCILLHDFDECDKQSRTAFLNFFNSRADGCEFNAKILVTSRQPGALLDEVARWPEINIDRLCSPEKTVKGAGSLEGSGLDGFATPASTSRDPFRLLTDLDLTRIYAARLERGRQHLKAMDHDRSSFILELLQAHSAWPEDISTRSLTKFANLLDRISPTTTAKDMLVIILQSLPDTGAVQWILKWLVHSYRPLTRVELATILYLQPVKGAQPSSDASPAALAEALSNITNWLRGVVDFYQDQMVVRSEVWNIFMEDAGTENRLLRDNSDICHSTILDFCLAYLSEPDVQEKAMRIYQLYLSQVRRAAGNKISPPMMPDGRDPLFYFIVALPYHASQDPCRREKITTLLKNRDKCLEVWSKLWWAMSNSLSRPREPPQYAYPLLAGLGLVDYRELGTSSRGRSKILILAAANKKNDVVMDLLGTRTDYSLSTLTNALEAATKAGDEDLALLIEKVLEFWYKPSREQPLNVQQNMSSPPSLLWRAVQLNMVRLMKVLLENGMRADPEIFNDYFFPSPLHIASVLGNAHAARVLLNHGADPKHEQIRCIALMRASAAGHGDVIKLLLSKEPSLLHDTYPMEVLGVLGRRQWQLSTPLSMASCTGHWKAVEALLQAGADPDPDLMYEVEEEEGKENDCSVSPLCFASMKGWLQTCEALLENGADVNRLGYMGKFDALFCAAVFAASVPCCWALIAHGANPNGQAQPLLVELVLGRSYLQPRPVTETIAVLDVFVDHRPRLDIDQTDSAGLTALMHASKRGSLPLVKWCVEHGANIKAVDNQGQSPLFYAVDAGCFDVVRDLLKWEVNIVTDTILQRALDGGNLALLERLLRAGEDSDSASESVNTLIRLAIHARNADAVKMLIKFKPDINRLDEYGWSPLCDAVGYVPDAKIARLLIDAGANVSQILEDSRRNLMHLAMGADADVICLLFEFPKAVDIDHRDEFGNTPLLVADNSTKVECVRLLLKAGADINAQNSDGLTPLMNAIACDAPSEVIQCYLSQPQLDPNIYSKIHGSALHVACRTLDKDIVNGLIRIGSDVNQHLPAPALSPLIVVCIPFPDVSLKKRENTEYIVRALIRAGADVNSTSKMAQHDSHRALSTASLWARTSTLEIFLYQGADVEARDPVGRQAIHFAAANGVGNLRAVMRFREGSVAIADNSGKTALHWAAQFGRLQSLKLLLSGMSPDERTRRVNEPDIDGWTPLCWAMRTSPIVWNHMSEPFECKGLVECLLQEGADPSIQCWIGEGQDKECFTLLHLAHLHDADEKMVALIRDTLTKGKDTPQGRTEWEGKTCSLYKPRDVLCDVCLCCYGRIDRYHQDFEDDNGTLSAHIFEVSDHEEFIDKSDIVDTGEDSDTDRTKVDEEEIEQDGGCSSQ